jgi:hypothetical protein
VCSECLMCRMWIEESIGGVFGSHSGRRKVTVRVAVLIWYADGDYGSRAR